MPGLFCAPATIDLAGAEIELVPMVAREGRLSRAIEHLDTSQFDYVLIDCPPSLGLLTVNALVAADEVLIPIQCEYYALEGLEQLLRTVELVRAHLNSTLKITTILLTMYDGRTRLATQVANDVREHSTTSSCTRSSPARSASPSASYGQSVITYDPSSSGAVAYAEAAANSRTGRSLPWIALGSLGRGTETARAGGPVPPEYPVHCWRGERRRPGMGKARSRCGTS